MNRRIFVVLIGLGVLAAGMYGCASIMNGTRQGISIASVPSGASVTIDGKTAGKTPAMIDLSRKDRHLIKIELEGYETYEMYLNRNVSGWVWGNVIFGGIPGLIIDAITGGLYKLSPDQISAMLGKKSAGLLKDDTIYITTVLRVDPAWEKIGNLHIQ